MMLQTIANGRETPAASAQLPLLCLGVVLLVYPMLARAQDRRCQVAIRKAEQPGPSAACLAAAAYDAKRGSLRVRNEIT